MLPVLRQVGPPDLQIINAQARTVPPETQGGYTGWHRVRPALPSPRAPPSNRNQTWIANDT